MLQKIKNLFTSATKTQKEKERVAKELEKEQIRLLNEPTELAKILRNYRNNEKPGYALLITGAWGVGKTHEITKRYLLPSSIYYVSLFGLKDVDQIHSNVFAKMHPIHSFIKNSTKSLEGGDVAAGILTLNIGNILPGIANALIKSEVKNDRIIVFDDFERCSIDIKDRLGAINTYVEHHDCRVIVISNDEKINNEHFSEAKEKLFGLTFEIKSHIEDIFEKLSSHHINNKSYPLLIELKEEIINTIKCGEINSLRIARHVINDNINLLECLDDKYKEKKESLRKVIKLFTAFSAEIRSGNISKNDIRNRENYSSKILLTQIKPQEIDADTLKFKKIQEKYESIGIELTDASLSDESLENSLIRGLFKPEDFENCLNKSFLYKNFKDAPAWQKMLRMDKLDDETTELIKNELITQFKERSITNPGEMLHLFSLMILMSDIGEIDKEMEIIKKECIQYIDDLYNNDNLASIKLDLHDRYRLISSHDGQGYWVSDKNRPIFIEVFEYLTKMMEQKLIEEHVKNSAGLLSTMINETDIFLGSICHQPYGDGSLAELPVLKNIAIENFFESFLKSPRKKWYFISSALKKRYNIHSFNTYLSSEIDWAIALVEHFETEANKLTGFKKYRLERVIPHEIKQVALEAKKQNSH